MMIMQHTNMKTSGTTIPTAIATVSPLEELLDDSGE